MSTYGHDEAARLDSLIRQAEATLERLRVEREQAEMASARFGQNSEYEDGAIIYFEQRFPNDPPSFDAYHYCALKVGALWFLTGKFQRGMTWDRLVAHHLVKAERVYIVTAMTEVQ